MTNAKKTQTRGNCPCCGRDQAVLASGVMSKHGYTVDHGWFNGVCSGDRYAPMQKARTVTDGIIAQVRADVVKLNQQAADLEAGKIFPATCKVSHMRNAEPVPFKDAPEWAQRDAVRTAMYQAQNRARAGESFANQMEALVNQVHGQPLRVVEVEEGPAPIRSGEQRKSARGVLTVTRVEGQRVYWKDEKGFKSWTGTQAWRKMEKAD